MKSYLWQSYFSSISIYIRVHIMSVTSHWAHELWRSGAWLKDTKVEKPTGNGAVNVNILKFWKITKSDCKSSVLSLLVIYSHLTCFMPWSYLAAGLADDCRYTDVLLTRADVLEDAFFFIHLKAFHRRWLSSLAPCCVKGFASGPGSQSWAIETVVPDLSAN